MSAGATDRARLLDMIGSSWRTQAIHAMVQLGLADQLADGPMTLVALAEGARANHEALSRLVRGLCLLELVERCGQGWRLTAMGQLLRTDSQQSLAQWAKWWAGVQWTSWGRLHEAVREGAPTRARCTGAAGYELQAMCEGAAGTFHLAMAQLSSGLASRLVGRLAALQPTRIVDLGGGRAELLGRLLLACPHAKGILLEQEHALPGARKHLECLDVLARCELLAGDFFQCVPEGADLYILKSVLHNWDDDSARRLLRTCRRAMRSHATLAVIERAIDEESPTEANVRSDLNMLVSLGGRERSPGELDDLLRGAGLAPMSPVDLGEHLLVLCPAA